MSGRRRPAPASCSMRSTRAACSPPDAPATATSCRRQRARNPLERRPEKGREAVLTRRDLMAGAAAGLLGGSFDAAAQEWPQRTIRIIVAFGPGGGSDIVGRIIAQSMQEKLGQSVVIENRPGAGGMLGNEAVARADKDGYT